MQKWVGEYFQATVLGALVGWRYSRRPVQEPYITLPRTVTIPKDKIHEVIMRRDYTQE